MSDRKTGAVAEVRELRHRYGSEVAVDGVSLDLPEGAITGIFGPDGVGKSTLMGLISGARQIQEGRVEVLGGSMREARHRNKVFPRIAYMPQGLGQNLYMALSVRENLDFFGRVFGQDAAQRDRRIDRLLRATRLDAFPDRPVGKLSGGMKQKLGLCCALVHEPELLILDEPTTGIDPLSRRQFWTLVDSLRAERADMTVLSSSAYMQEAGRFDRLVAMHDGRVLKTGTPQSLCEETGTETLEDAFAALLPEEARGDRLERRRNRREIDGERDAISAEGLVKRFGDFTAV